MESFSDWLLNVLKQRNMSQSDLARLAKIGTGTISNIMSGNRKVGKNTLQAIAHALKLPPETVFRAAGILPQQPPETEIAEQIIHLTKELPAQEQSDILEFVKLRHRIAEERQKNEAKQPRSKPAIP